MKKSMLLATLLATLSNITAPAFAGTIFNNSTTFKVTLGTKVTDDYENGAYVFIQSNTQMSSVLGETQYTSTAFSNSNIVFESAGNHMYCAGCNGSFLLDFTTTSVSGVNGIYGVGFDYFNHHTPNFHAFVTYGDGNTEDVSLDPIPFSTTAFWGITSDQLISSIHFGLANGGVTTDGAFGIDNLTIGNAKASVPEPSSLLLIVLGFAGAVLSRRKQAV